MGKVVKSSLVDRYGKPICYFFEGADLTRRGDTDFKEACLGFNDTNDILRVFEWRDLLRMGRFLYANVPMIRGALREECSYAFPLENHYVGADQKWGDIATEWLYGWDQNCTLRGVPFDQQTCAKLRRIGRACDGDIFTVLTQDPDSQYPKLQLIRAHRCGDRSLFHPRGMTNLLQNGPYKGLPVCNGVVEDEWGRPVAFQFLGRVPEMDQWISAGNVIHSFEPEYSDYPRGITELLTSIKSVAELKRLNDFEMRAQNAMSGLAIIEKNESGTSDEAETAINSPPDGTDTAGTATGLITETYEAGLIRYLRSGTGASIEAFRGDRPSADAARFEERIVRRAFYGIGWDADFALALKDPGGAWSRKIIAGANRTIAGLQRLEARDLRQMHVWALSQAVYKLKILPPPKDGDIFSWNYKGPAKITVDGGNEENAKREAYKLGTLTLSDLSLEKGLWWTEIREQRQREVSDLLTRALVLKAEFPEFTEQEILSLLEQRTPNVQNPTPGQGYPEQEQTAQSQ